MTTKPQSTTELGIDTNFPLSETLRLLVEWVRHLHVSHECDCDGWEQRSFLIEAAQRYRAEIAQSLFSASAAPVVDTDSSRRLIGSSRHPHFTHADRERMKATLDTLSDYPTEEEAEAVLQACGTSGKEVVNEFIERLLKENLELKYMLAAATAAPVEQLLCACRTFTLDPASRAYLDGTDYVHTVDGCPERRVTEDNE